MRKAFVFYTATLVLGLLADIAYCWFRTAPNIGLQFVPGLYCVGILFAAITFGTSGGLGAAILAGICHTTAGFMCHQHIPEPGALFIFVLIAITAGWLTHPKKKTVEKPYQRTEGITIGNNREGSGLAQMSAIEPTRAGLIHQLRTPVASIEGAAFLLDDPDLSEEKREEFVDIVRRECHRLQGLLESLETRQPQL